MNKKNIFVWALYDFANSIFMIVFFLYFSQWLVVEKGVSDFWFNMIFTAGSLLLLITVPVVGSIADRIRGQHAFLLVITLLTIVSLFAVTFTALFFPQKVFLAALFFLITNYFYQFSFVFYNALLHDIAPRAQWGRISGIGQAGNWLGQIVGLLIALPFASGAVYLFGAAGRAQTFLPSVVLFIILALPMFLFFRLPGNHAAHDAWTVTGEYKSQWCQWKSLVKNPSMKMFLLSYFFFNDAVITAANNFPLYLEHVFAVSDSTKSMILVGILVTSVIGALASGWVADAIGIGIDRIYADHAATEDVLCPTFEFQRACAGRRHCRVTDPGEVHVLEHVPRSGYLHVDQRGRVGNALEGADIGDIAAVRCHVHQRAYRSGGRKLRDPRALTDDRWCSDAYQVDQIFRPCQRRGLVIRGIRRRVALGNQVHHVVLICRGLRLSLSKRLERLAWF